MSSSPPLRVIGMISGTSFDAIEAVAVELTLERDELVADLRRHVSVPYADELHAAVAAVLPPARTTIDEVCRLDIEIGGAFAAAAGELSREAFDGAVDVVCSHGQTVFHWVRDGRALGTLQLGQAAIIAERTGATVVSDVRNRDIASGGQGAPLASLIDVLLLGAHPDTVRASLNLGGISNATIVGPDRDPIAFDCGPANALIDAAAAWITDGRELCDLDGRHAARGRVDEELLLRLLDEPYYRLPAPKSTGKELFHLGYLRERIGGRPIEPDDLFATLTAHAAEVVAADLRAHSVTEVIAAGGGTRNPALMAELRGRLPGVAIGPIDAYGVPEGAKEALVFALIGFLTVNGIAGTVPSCTGARHAEVLGVVTPGRVPVPAAGAAEPPARLTVRTRLPVRAGLQDPDTPAR